MDEKDYKAMNKEMMSYEESRKYLISEGLDPDQIAKEGMVFIKTVKENLELKNQLKEKEDEIKRLRSLLFTSERFRMEDAATSIDDRNILHAKHMECVKQLTKSNEMNERLAKALESSVNGLIWFQEEYPSSYSKNDTEHLSKCKDILTEYQNSKK